MMRKLVRRRKGERGFTFIEVLIVVTVIGILMAVIVPRIGSVLETGRITACRASAESLQLAMERYFIDETEYPESKDIKDYDDLVDTLEDYVELPQEERAVFEFDDGYELLNDDPWSYCLEITAKDRAGTLFTITEEGISES